MFYTYISKLPPSYRHKIDVLKAAVRAATGRLPGWADVVDLARDASNGALFAPETEELLNGRSQPK